MSVFISTKDDKGMEECAVPNILFLQSYTSSTTMLVLKRKLSNIQWMAIVLLAVGTTTGQVKGCGDAPCDSLFAAPFQGYMLEILSACLSALAGVYTEYLMKKNNDSLYWQNLQLFAFGVIFNMGWLVYGDYKAGFELGPWWQRLFNGYSITTCMVVFNLGSTGLVIDEIFRQYSQGVLNFNGHAFDNGFVYISFQRESYYSAFLRHYHLHNFPADVFYACAHAC